MVSFTAWNDVAVVDFVKSQLDFEEFKKTIDADKVHTIPEMRTALYKYTKKRLFVPGRTPNEGEGFNEKWNHLCDVVVHKAIKDMFIRDFNLAVLDDDSKKSKTVTLAQIKENFFDAIPYDELEQKGSSSLEVNMYSGTPSIRGAEIEP